MGEQFKRRSNMTILRSAILKNNIMVKTPAAAAGSGGGAVSVDLAAGLLASIPRDMHS